MLHQNIAQFLLIWNQKFYQKAPQYPSIRQVNIQKYFSE